MEPASVGEDVVLAKKGDVDDFYKDFPQDCRCYMQVLSVENPTNSWYLYDFTDASLSDGYALYGIGSTYWYDGNQIIYPFPSMLQELDIPSDGEHEIVLWPNLQASEELDPDFTINVSVVCRYGGLDADPSYGRTYQFSFVYESGLPTWPNSILRSFFIDLDCEFRVDNPK